mmetsp:Transcript_56351/g.134508  ORF Transcript_56351/g.134508 Transcript_56351/m.134508 type:complete len:342 (+) Transcript_56351:436-1461(+)
MLTRTVIPTSIASRARSARSTCKPKARTAHFGAVSPARPARAAFARSSGGVRCAKIASQAAAHRSQAAASIQTAKRGNTARAANFASSSSRVCQRANRAFGPALAVPPPEVAFASLLGFVKWRTTALIAPAHRRKAAMLICSANLTSTVWTATSAPHIVIVYHQRSATFGLAATARQAAVVIASAGSFALWRMTGLPTPAPSTKDASSMVIAQRASSAGTGMLVRRRTYTSQATAETSRGRMASATQCPPALPSAPSTATAGARSPATVTGSAAATSFAASGRSAISGPRTFAGHSQLTATAFVCLWRTVSTASTPPSVASVPPGMPTTAPEVGSWRCQRC